MVNKSKLTEHHAWVVEFVAISWTMIPRILLVFLVACIMLLNASHDQKRTMQQIQGQTHRTRFRSALVDPTGISSTTRPPSRLNTTRPQRSVSRCSSYAGAFLVHHPSKFAAFAVIWVRQMVKLALFFGIGLTLLRVTIKLDTHLILCIADLLLGIITSPREEQAILKEESLRSMAMLAFKAESLIVQRSIYFALLPGSNFNDLHLMILCFFYAIVFSLINAVLSGWIRPKLDFS